jgi:DNA N-6-adenine-methyltransferase (Dam).
MTAIQTSIFDYAALDSETRIVVQQRTSEIKALMKRAASDIIEAGMKSIEVRSLLRHNKGGGFEGWIKHENLESRMIYHFIRVAETFGNFENFSKLNIGVSALYLLAAPSTPEAARAEALARAEQGEAITYSAARDLIEQAQEERRYDGFAKVYPPEDDKPLPFYEQRGPVMSQPMSILTSQGTIEWYTPPDIIERARVCLGGIDLDPASSEVAQRWIKADTYYTADMPATHAWAGRVWLNPPFDDTPAWVDQLDSEYVDGAVTAAILLVNSAPGYIWWEDLWRRRPVCMLRERVCFIRSDGVQGDAAKKGTTIAYYGDDVQSFTDAFGDLGRVILPED